jgi:hypothetical protein
VRQDVIDTVGKPAAAATAEAVLRQREVSLAFLVPLAVIATLAG